MVHIRTVAILGSSCKACAYKTVITLSLYLLVHCGLIVRLASRQAFTQPYIYVFIFIMAIPAMKIPYQTLREWEESGGTLNLIMDFVGIDLNVSNSLIGATGLDPEGHAADVAFFPDDEWQEMISTLTVDDNPILPIQKSRLRQLLSACRQLSLLGSDPPPAAPLLEDSKQDVPEDGVSEAAGTAKVEKQPVTPTLAEKAAPSIPTLEQPPKIRTEVAVVDDLCTVKLSEVALQGTETKVALIAADKMREGKKRYKLHEGADPEPEEAPTREQASAFLAILLQLMSIYLDFAVFGPFGSRLIKRRRFDALVPGPDNLFMKVELAGPGSYREWELCWRCFRTLCIMWNIICPAFLDRYARKIRKYADEFPEAWGLIYQADVRCRLEYAPEVRERLEDQHAEDEENNKRSHYEVDRPWNSVFRALLSKEESDFWYRNVEKPGLLILAGSAKPGDVIGDDAPVRPPPTSTTQPASEPYPKRPRLDTTTTVPYVPAPPRPEGYAPRQGKGTPRNDLSVHDGTKYLKNRAGACLCPGYQTGMCTRLNTWNLCAQDGQSAHQCEVCLMVGHGSSETTKCPKQKGAGKGRGAGRRQGAGQGRGGRRGQH